MPAVPLSRRLAIVLVSLAAGLVLLAPASASAGAYTVYGACADWEIDKQPAVDANGTGCDFALANSVQPGAPPAAGGNQSRWIYRAPAGAFVAAVSLTGGLSGSNGWQARVVLEDGGPPTIVADCPSDASFRPSRCGSFMTLQDDTDENLAQLSLQVQCAATSCPRDRVYSRVNTIPDSIDVTIKDFTRPGVAVTGGNLLEGWRRGKGSYSYDAGDNVGIRSVAPVVDGTVRDAVFNACARARKVPCPNGGGAFEIDTRGLSDGAHQVSVEAEDSATNLERAQARTVRVDNTAPAAPLELSVSGGEGWRRGSEFDVTWVSPKQDAAPVNGLAYRFCPEATPLEKTDDCGDVQVAARLEAVDNSDPARGTRVQGLKIPSVGAQQVRFFLRDEAGNAAEKTAVVRTLRYDPDPPTLAFLPQDLGDPARVRVRAGDATSGVARGEIEAQREGEPVWRQLPVEPGPDGFSAVFNDEMLPKGTYVLRARAVDQAGNEASSNQRADGAVATLNAPIRLPSQLDVGARGKQTCRGRGKKRTCRYKLRRSVGVSYSASTRLYGRLRAGGQPIAGTTVQVWSQTKLPGAPLERIEAVQTSQTGRFSIRAAKGPARLLRFRYPGTKHVRGATGEVRLGVRAATTFRPARSRVLNGEYLTLRGQVLGGPLPATGKLVELQVYARRQWRTFAQPRTDPQGRWEYRYRFEQIRRSTRFRFRARLRTEAGFPYETGTSKTRRILVRGGG